MHKVSTILYPLLVCAFSVRFLIKGAELPDALLAVSVVALIAVQTLLEARKPLPTVPLNDKVLQELADLKSTVNTLKVARAFGKI